MLPTNTFTGICFVDTQISGNSGSGGGGRRAPSCKREEVRKLPKGLLLSHVTSVPTHPNPARGHLMPGLAHEDAQDGHDFCSNTKVLMGLSHSRTSAESRPRAFSSPGQLDLSTVPTWSWIIHVGGELFAHCHTISTSPGPYPL